MPSRSAGAGSKGRKRRRSPRHSQTVCPHRAALAAAAGKQKYMSLAILCNSHAPPASVKTTASSEDKAVRRTSPRALQPASRQRLTAQAGRQGRYAQRARVTCRTPVASNSP